MYSRKSLRAAKESITSDDLIELPILMKGFDPCVQIVHRGDAAGLFLEERAHLLSACRKMLPGIDRPSTAQITRQLQP